MGKKLTKAPVYYTIAQVLFNPVMDLDGYISAFQSKMREADYPDYKKSVVQQLVLPLGVVDQGQPIAPSSTPESRYVFGDIDKRSLFLLQTNSLSFQTTNYDTFESFSKTFMMGLDMLHNTLHLNFVERIGLRYLDAVQPTMKSESLRDYLVPEVLGLSLIGDGQLQHTLSETIKSTSETGNLVSRVIIRNGRVGLPNDLEGWAPIINSRFTQEENLHAIVDTDAYITNREIFELNMVEERLVTLHSEVVKSFNATVTDYALKTWA